VLVVGPTASGKTALAIALAEALGGEIVNADSVQIYRGLDIGSCKPTAAEQARVRHHLIDVLEPDDPCDAGRFVALADAAIADIRARGRAPLVVGGTGLWFRALVHGLAPAPAVPDSVRARIQAELARLGPAALHERLRQVDPQAAARIAPQDPQRITRALEVFEAAGQPLSALQAAHRFAERRYDALVLALDWPRAALYARIDRRVAELMGAGFLAEVDGLLARGLSPDLRPLRSLGYAELSTFRRGAGTLDEAVARIAQGHRRYAKRQLTWFRGVPETVWLPPGDAGRERALQLARDHLADPAVPG
jgi:tRNA dimethylallyltransferase